MLQDLWIAQQSVLQVAINCHRCHGRVTKIRIRCLTQILLVLIDGGATCVVWAVAAETDAGLGPSSTSDLEATCLTPIVRHHGDVDCLAEATAVSARGKNWVGTADGLTMIPRTESVHPMPPLVFLLCLAINQSMFFGAFSCLIGLALF